MHLHLLVRGSTSRERSRLKRLRFGNDQRFQAGGSIEQTTADRHRNNEVRLSMEKMTRCCLLLSRGEDEQSLRVVWFFVVAMVTLGGFLTAGFALLRRRFRRSRPLGGQKNQQQQQQSLIG